MFCGLSVYQERVIGVGGSTYMELGDELSADFSLYLPELYRRAAFFEQFFSFLSSCINFALLSSYSTHFTL